MTAPPSAGRWVSVISTGGTISGAAAARASDSGSFDPADRQQGVILRPVPLMQVASRSMSVEHMLDLATAIEREVASGAQGVVVTHGTDTMEETAYLLSLVLGRTAPVVLTGAMRLPGAPGFDGEANVRDAVAVAIHEAAAELGPVVVMDEAIHLARWVTKSHTSSPSAFASPDAGPIGRVTEGRPRLTGLPVATDLLGLPGASALSEVELVWIAAGVSPRLLETACAHAAGVVVAGTGGGHVPAGHVPALESALAAGTPVVVASRCGAGSTMESTYAGPGGEVELRAAGVFMAGQLSPLKARLRLQIALALGLAPADVFPVP